MRSVVWDSALIFPHFICDMERTPLHPSGVKPAEKSRLMLSLRHVHTSWSGQTGRDFLGTDSALPGKGMECPSLLSVRKAKNQPLLPPQTRGKGAGWEEVLQEGKQGRMGCWMPFSPTDPEKKNALLSTVLKHDI